jgi:hypothetical protein
MTPEQEEMLGRLMLARAVKEGHIARIPDMSKMVELQERAVKIFTKPGQKPDDTCLEYLRSIAPEEVRYEQVAIATGMGRETARHALHRLAGLGLVSTRLGAKKAVIRLWKAI